MGMLNRGNIGVILNLTLAEVQKGLRQERWCFRSNLGFIEESKMEWDGCWAGRVAVGFRNNPKQLLV